MGTKRPPEYPFRPGIEEVHRWHSENTRPPNLREWPTSSASARRSNLGRCDGSDLVITYSPAAPEHNEASTWERFARLGRLRKAR
jgi:hypothetical protein